MLDGEDALFHSSSGTIAHLAEWEDYLPEMIVVGIRNTDRTRDMLPTAVTLPSGRCLGGGTDAFLNFLADELIPFMKTNYRVSDYRVFCGTSASALAVVYEYLSQRVGFSAYLASSPTLDWDERLLFRMVEGQESYGLPTDAPLSMFCGGHDQGSIAADCGAFAEALRTLDPDKQHVDFRLYEDDGHCPFEGFRNGLLWLTKDWRVSEACIDQGIDAVNKHFETLRLSHGFNISVRAYEELAHRWASRGRLNEALAWLRQGRVAYPSSTDIIFGLAVCLIRNMKEDDARELLVEATASNPADLRLSQLLERIRA
jgi:predicted alpha/beta superfamily hydrolase